ncbi:CapA family protein [Desulfomonile tiedjei]|uniref:Putative enzyme of poly-gamma-glutamate biosynthesis (Capsule formation) n=1 Tax=Desulfomonile tiedjei (strain ATCC 49306 / DSM 6799 / DCB-1) TaxID=706587 RepID=I4C1M4_DESTA|nr:CapA family protein [Desulfomonile tiedjei]AFM23465.1 putative enzyme of poly-gamma-glutamate biosynthesis (capsule formation) [Desulfomonile tiedjei DSM 6799]
MAEARSSDQSLETSLITIFLAGDVMTGRGIDQVMPHPSDPTLYEPYIRDASAYVHLGEQANGPIPKPISHSYIWGDALGELKRMSPHVRIINLETSVTTSDDYWEGKGINYRMHPENVPCITEAEIDLCVLANNHTLDWGYSGLIETLETLKNAKVKTVGAGRNREEAEAPAILEVGKEARVVVFAFGFPTSGIPLDWVAEEDSPGVNLFHDLSDQTVCYLEGKVREAKRRGDLVIASIHWGGNWGYGIHPEEIEFAHNLIDRAGIDIIHGHSSHHVKGIEVYKGKPILYGCGDFLDDYEGISGYEEFRDDLGLMFFVTMDAGSGRLVGMQMIPTQIRNFKINRASRSDALWLRDTLNREGGPFGTLADLDADNILNLQWDETARNP